MNLRTYDTTFRPNFELYGATAWLIAGGMAASAPFLISAPTDPYLSFTAISVAMAARRLPSGLRLLRTKRGLKGRDLTFINLKDLGPILERHTKEESLWLGYGWEWDNRHAQLYYEFTKRSKDEVYKGKRDPKKKGDQRIHGLNVDEHEISQPLSHTSGHTLIVGTTGSGKTRMFDHLITQAICRKNEAVIIIDPKGDRELCENARAACRQAGDESRFFYFHPAFPEKSVRIDPLRNFSRATELASRIAVLMASEQGNPFQAFGQMALNNVAQGILTAGSRPNLVKVRSYLEGGVDTLVADAIKAYADKHYPSWEHILAPYIAKANTPERQAHALIKFYREKIPLKSPDLEGLFSMFEHNRDHFQKMIASLLPIMSMLTSGDLGRLLSPDSTDMDDERPITDFARIIRSNQVLYIGLDSLSDSMVGSAIGSILLSDLTAVAGDRYNYGLVNNPVNLYVDETAEVVNLPLIQVLNKGRGAGYAATLATQTFADFAAAMGDENKARQVLGNLNNIISLRVTDAETQEYICKSLPKTRVKYVMQTQGTNSSSTPGESHSGNIGERLMEEEIELIQPQMLGQLPDLEFFARLVDGRLMKGRLPILTKEAA